MTDLVSISRRAKGSAVLPTVSFGVLNAEQLILRMADRIEDLEAKLKWVIEERDTTFALMLKRAESAEAKLAEAEEALDFYATCDADGDQDRCRTEADAIAAWNTRHKPLSEQLFDQQISDYVKRGKP